MNTDEYKLFISECKKSIGKSKPIDVTFDDKNINNLIFKNYYVARQKAANIRQKYINIIDELLVSFEKKSIENGVDISWCVDYDILIEEVVELLNDRKIKEVNLFETKFTNELGLHKNLKDEEISIISQNNKCVIFEPKYAISQSGSLFLVFNSAFEMELVLNAELKIFVIPFSNIIKNIEDIQLLTNLYSSNNEKKDFPYLSTIYTPKKSDDKNIKIFIVDNGRTNLLESKSHRMALTCIDCDACKKVCPIYGVIGDNPYNNVFTGPIANVTLPYLETIDSYKHLSFNCVLCGNCKKVCPMNIPITDLIISNRNIFFERKYIDFNDRYKIKILKNNLISRKKLNRKHWIKELLFRFYFSKKVASSRELPKFSKYTFEQIKSGKWKK
ncbi:MAG: [Fe-S]-binding protein [Bacteroidetes bacterium]|nr:[Fe-S]-binding protein [Bacteroidota bacterium]